MHRQGVAMKTRLYSFSLTALLSAYLLAGGGASCSPKQESHSEKPMSETQNATPNSTPNATQMKIEEKIGLFDCIFIFVLIFDSKKVKGRT